MLGRQSLQQAVLCRAMVVLLFAGLTTSAFAATKTWNCPTASGNWSNGANWGGTAPAAGDTLVFNCAVTSNADLSAGTRIAAVILGANSGGSIINGAIQFNSALAAASNVEDNANGATNTINATIQLANGRSWFKSSVVGHTLEFKGTISGIGTGGAVPVENGIRIYGPGTVKFNHNTDNTYIGDTTVHSADGNGANGSLQLAGNAFNVIPGNFIVGTSTTASNAANRPQARLLASQVIADSSKLTVGPDGLLAFEAGEIIGQLLGTGGVNIINPLGTLTVGDAGDFTWGGVISGAGNVKKVGTGTLTYTAANTYTGTTTVSNGTLMLNAGFITKAILGPLVIGEAAGATTPPATVRLGNANQINRVASDPPITINSNGTLDTRNFFEDVGLITMNGGNITIDNSTFSVLGGLNMTGGTISSGGFGTLVLGSDVVATASPQLGQATISSTVTTAQNTKFTVNSGSTAPELTISGPLSRTTLLVNLLKTGTGTLRLAGTTANNYGGSTTIERGILELDKPGGVTAITGPIVIGNSTDSAGSAVLRSLGTQQIGGNPSVTINASGAFNLNSASVSNQRAETIGGLSGTGSLLMPNFSTLTIDIPSGSATFGGAVNSQTSTTSLIQKRGVGEQIFTGNGSAFVARASVFQGRLTVNSPGVLGSLVEIDNGGELGGTGQIGRLTVYDGGRVRPGNGSGGTLRAAGPTAFNSGSTLVIDLGGASPARYRGVLDVVGTLTLGSGAKLSLQPAFSDPIAPTFIPKIVDGFSSVVGRFQNLPEGAMIAGGPYNFQITYSNCGGASICLTSRNTLDIDGDGKYLAGTDGLLIARYISNPANAALTANAVATANGPQRVSHTDILGYLDRVASALDIDQSGARDTTDSLLIARWLFGFRGEGLVAGIATPVGVTRESFISRVEFALRIASP
ncbi:MAG: hypothetical protein EAZ30_01495 [Betaproteobacteria bacterium]|nr:MAG: hypothetical protein EAZ30_01495 [Betaproteobacteria bacterium]